MILFTKSVSFQLTPRFRQYLLTQSKRFSLTRNDTLRKQGLAFGVGLFAGCMGSMVGMGGAFVALPFLTGPIGLAQHSAHGTSIVAVLLTSIGGTISFTSKSTEEQYVDVTTSACIAVTSSIMAVIGARLSKKIPAHYLKIAVGTFMLAIAPIAPMKQHFNNFLQNGTRQSKSLDMKVMTSLSIGVGSGLLAGIFGVGGGAIVVPALCIFSDLDYKTSLGSSLLAMMPTAVFASATHFWQGTMVVPIAIPLGFGCLIGNIIEIDSS